MGIFSDFTEKFLGLNITGSFCHENLALPAQEKEEATSESVLISQSGHKPYHKTKISKINAATKFSKQFLRICVLKLLNTILFPKSSHTI